MSDRTKRRVGMSVGAILLLGLLLAGMLVVFQGGAATAKQIATLHVYEGLVEVERGDSASPATDGQALREGDTVRTGADGRAEIEYFDGSVTRLDFSTAFTLETLETIENEAGSKVIEASQAEGNTYNRVTELTDSESRFDIDTPTATASVQGTVYAVLLGPDGSTTIAVIEGSVLVTTPLGEIEVPEGKMVTIGPDGSIGELEDIPEELLNSDWILYNQCDLDQIRDCVLGEVVTPEEEPEETEEPEEEPTDDGLPPGGSVPTPTDGGGSEGGGGGGGGSANQAPIAGLVTSSLSGPAPHTVAFSDASTDPDGDTLTRSWTFGDGSSHSGGTSLLHTYTTPGSYLATLTVTDPDGASDAVSALVLVTDGDTPVVAITSGPDDPSDSDEATFTFTSSEAGTGFQCSLDGGAATPCGGGSTGVVGLIGRLIRTDTPVNGSITYTGLEDGPHGFTVSVTDAGGNSGSASWSWTIDTAPVLDHIAISPSASTITLGESQAYSVTAYDSDGVSMGDVTAATTFSGANCGGNVCSPTSPGDKTVTAIYLTETATAVLHVLEPAPAPVELDHIEISPFSATITYGGSQAYTAIAIAENGTSLGDVTADTTFTGADCTGSVCSPNSIGPKTVTGSYVGPLGADDDTASLTVERAPLTVTADDQDITYGGAAPAFTFGYAGFVLGDGPDDLDTEPTCGVAGPHANAGSYTIVCSSGAAANYAFSYVNGTLTVDKATLTVTADAKAKVQGAANPPLTYAITGFVNGDDEDDLTTAPSCSTTAVTGSPVGDYPITCSGGVDDNYDFTYVGALLSVGPRTVITVTADDKGITYGDLEPAFTFTYSPVPASAVDTPPACGVTGDHANAGTYTITCSGAADDIYDFSYTSGTLRVGKATLVVTPSNVTISEGDTPAFPFSYSGFVSPDTAAVIDSAPICGAGAGPFTAAGSPYTISCSGGSDDNYSFVTSATATLTVNAAPPACPTYRLVFTGPDLNDRKVGQSLTPTPGFQVQTLGGTPVNNSGLDITVTLGGNDEGATLSGTTTVNPAAGSQSNFPGLSINVPGTYTLVATAPCATSASSNAFTITANAPVSVGGATQSGASTIGPSHATAVPDTGESREREGDFRALGVVIALPLLRRRVRKHHR